MGLEDPGLDAEVAFEVEEAPEPIRLGDAEVVARQDPEAPAALQELHEVGADEVEPAVEDERDGDARLGRDGEAGREVGLQRVVLAANQGGLVGPAVEPVVWGLLHRALLQHELAGRGRSGWEAGVTRRAPSQGPAALQG